MFSLFSSSQPHAPMSGLIFPRYIRSLPCQWPVPSPSITVPSDIINHQSSTKSHPHSCSPPSPASVPESCVGSVADELQAAAAAQHWRCGVKRKVIQDVRD